MNIELHTPFGFPPIVPSCEAFLPPHPTGRCRAYLISKPEMSGWLGHHVGLHLVYMQVMRMPP